MTKYKKFGYLRFQCNDTIAGDFLYVNLTGTDVKSYTAAKSITVTKDKKGAIVSNPTLTITADIASSKPASTVVKAKCPSFGELWVHWQPKVLGTHTLYAGVSEI